MTIKEISLKLFDIGAIKIDFEKGWTLKSGKWSPVYINLRILQSYPEILSGIATQLDLVIKNDRIEFGLLASIPLAAVPLGIVLSQKTGVPHILPRMDSKKHGLGVKIDGVYEKGQRVLLIDDLITKATSKLEAVEELTAAGLTVTDVAVVVDREQGGREELAKHGLTLHAAMKFTHVLEALRDKGKITAEVYGKLTEYLKTS